MLSQRLSVGLGAQLLQELRGALDVGEEEGNGPGGKIAAHGDDDAPDRRRRHGTGRSPGL